MKIRLLAALFRRVLFAALVAALVGLVVPAAGADDETKRPVKDWYADKRDPIEAGLQANGQNAFLPNFWNDDYWLAGGFAPYGCGMTDEVVKTVDGKTRFRGRITETSFPDGTAEVRIAITVTNSPVTVFRTQEMFVWLDACFNGTPIPLPDPIAGAGGDGYLDYELEIGMIIPEPSAVIANWLSVIFGFLPPPYELTGDFSLHAEGSATFTDAAGGGPEGFISGGTTEVVYTDESIGGAPRDFAIELRPDD